jgi:hypothetical protein
MSTILDPRPRRVRVDIKVRVPCADCGHQQLLSSRHARRVRRGTHRFVCDECRNPDPAEYDADDLRWWLERFGRTLPEGADVYAYLRVFGIPGEVREISLGMQHFSVRSIT